ncbi:hypothetical protein B0H14DRAFT_3133097 [Mycena olivaceomarginata]|nr:hypothetical protein B0H14DRAFT_3133097 [Mycena olivaceomarginata]
MRHAERESDSRGIQAAIRNTIDAIDEEIAQDLRTSAAGKCGECTETERELIPRLKTQDPVLRLSRCELADNTVEPRLTVSALVSVGIGYLTVCCGVGFDGSSIALTGFTKRLVSHAANEQMGLHPACDEHGKENGTKPTIPCPRVSRNKEEKSGEIAIGVPGNVTELAPQAKPSKPAQPNSNSAKRGKPFWQARRFTRCIDTRSTGLPSASCHLPPLQITVSVVFTLGNLPNNFVPLSSIPPCIFLLRKCCVGNDPDANIRKDKACSTQFRQRI